MSDLEKRAEEKRVQEIDWEQFLENRTLQQPLPSNRGGFEELPPIEQNLTKSASLVDHLRWQLQLSDFTDDEKKLAELVLGNLDDNGFLDLKGIERENGEKTPDLTIEDLAREVPIDPEDAECVLREMQEWDPVGVCARSLQECLHVQAEVLRLRRPRAPDHRQAPAQPREAQLPGHRARPEGHRRRGLRGGQADPEAREPPGAQLHRDRRQDDRHHARRLRHQGRRQVRRHRQRPRRAAPLHQRVAHQAAPQGPAGQGVHRREAPQRAVADPRHRAAAKDDHPGHRVHRRQAARLLREGRRATSSR